MSRTITIPYHDCLPAYVDEQEQEQNNDKAVVKSRKKHQREMEKPLKKNEHKAGTLTVTFTVNGKRVVATCIINDVVNIGAAKCHPQDKFDLRIGMELALKRMLQRYSMYKGEPFFYLDEQFNVKKGVWHGSQREKTMKNNGNVFISEYCANQAKNELKQFFENKLKRDLTVGGIGEW